MPQDQRAQKDSLRIVSSIYLSPFRLPVLHAHLNWPQHFERERERDYCDSIYDDFVALRRRTTFNALAAFQLKFHLVVKTRVAIRRGGIPEENREKHKKTEQNKSINLYDFLMCFIRHQSQQMA